MNVGMCQSWASVNALVLLLALLFTDPAHGWVAILGAPLVLSVYEQSFALLSRLPAGLSWCRTRLCPDVMWASLPTVWVLSLGMVVVLQQIPGMPKSEWLTNAWSPIVAVWWTSDAVPPPPRIRRRQCPVPNDRSHSVRNTTETITATCTPS